MPVAIVIVAAVILGGVVVVAMGRGGELSRERPDLPVQTDFRTWSDVAGYRPPPALLGYNPRATQHALSLIARTLAERDAEIEWLRNRIAELRPSDLESPAAADAWVGGGAGAGEADAAAEPLDDRGTEWFAAPPEPLSEPAAELPGTDADAVEGAASGAAEGAASGAAEVAEAPGSADALSADEVAGASGSAEAPGSPADASGAAVADPAADAAGEAPAWTPANGTGPALARASGNSAESLGDSAGARE